MVVSPNNRVTTLLPTFTVDSYRNVDGYSFLNDGQGYSDFSFDDLTAVFGEDQTHISVDVCGILTLGLENCTVDTGIPDPLAYLELAIINEVLPPDAGECLGFSLSSARLSLGLGQLKIDDFPTQAGHRRLDRVGPVRPVWPDRRPAPAHSSRPPRADERRVPRELRRGHRRRRNLRPEFHDRRS